MRKLITIITISSLAIFNAYCKITAPPFFSDNMVLQQNANVKLWGESRQNATVTISASWDKRKTTVRSTSDGKWSAELSTTSAGGPYTITISDGKSILKFKNVLLGEVWLCTGQSNMELKLRDNVIGMQEEMANAHKLTNIRLLHVQNATSPTPTDKIGLVGEGWQECSSESIADFSATGYFFGKYLNQELNVPVGLIETCWGGTLAEAWTSESSLRDIPSFKNRLDGLKVIPETNEGRIELYKKQMAEWEVKMQDYDRGFENGVALWAQNDLDDSEWTDCEVPGFLQEQKIEGMHDFFWMRKTIVLPDSWAGHDLILDLGAVDDNDFTYFNGVRVGHTEGCIMHRQYRIPYSIVKAGKNTIGVRVMDTGGMSGILGDDNNILLTKSETEKMSLTGKWKCAASISIAEAPTFPLNTATEANYPTFLYNAMIYPLRDFSVKGAIWYQGEANTSMASQYKDLLPLMIRDWRRTWNFDFPFYIVQLANYMKVQTGAEESEWAELREAQLQTSKTLDNTGLAVIIDIGEEGDIHPKNKSEVGRRLCLNALGGTYGKKIEYSGPIYSGYDINGNSIRIRFSHCTGGLKGYSYAEKSDRPNLEGFYIAGGDHVFHKADAKIEGETVVVSSPDVLFPIAVRYAWANNPVCNLYNGANLPASPFRTDIW